MLQSIALLALACTSSGAPGPAVPAPDHAHWTRFRGPSGAGVGRADDLPRVPTRADWRWRSELPGRGPGSPVVWGERVFVCAEEEGGARVLACLSVADGETLWTRSADLAPYERHQDLNTHASSSPSVDADGVYVQWVDGDTLQLHAFDHAGEPRWTRELGPYRAGHGAGSSPVAADGRVYVAAESDAQACALFALDAGSGEVLWRQARDTGKASFATPCPWSPEGGAAQVLMASTAHGVSSLDAASGRVLWEHKQLFRQRVVASPFVAGGLLFSSAGRGGGGVESATLALDPAGGAPELLYRRERALPYVPTALVWDGLMFTLADGGIASCFDARSGEELWRERVDANFYGSPVVIDGRLYAMSLEGELIVLAAAAEFELLGSSDLGEGSYATPAVAGGVLFLRTERHLIAVAGDA